MAIFRASSPWRRKFSQRRRSLLESRALMPERDDWHSSGRPQVRPVNRSSADQPKNPSGDASRNREGCCGGIEGRFIAVCVG